MANGMTVVLGLTIKIKLILEFTFLVIIVHEQTRKRIKFKPSHFT